MGLERKWCEKGSFYVYYPEIEMHSPFRRYSLIIIREDGEEESVKELINLWKLEDFATEEKCVIAFPNPRPQGWDSYEEQERTAFLKEVHSKMCEPEDYVFETDSNGIPLLKSMLNRWHLMNDTRYYIGIGGGAKVACELACVASLDVAAVGCVGAEKEELPKDRLRELSMPLYTASKDGFDFQAFYRDFFSKVRRINTGKYGEVCERMDFGKASFDFYVRDQRLEEEKAFGHTWFVHCPSVKREVYPMMLFFHGGSDNPAEAAEMSRFHELGEKEGFITVYPWGSDEASWNVNYTDTGFDDVAYIRKLIEWMKKNYPVDESRIYLSGFSNGAAMAQVYAMEYPEQIAGICHIDSNWPGKRVGPAGLTASDVIAFRRARKKKEVFDYLMPVWYTYGTREPSYPVFNGCSQQLQYDFWKEYNHIPIKATPEKEACHPCGCGVPGEVCEELTPSEAYPGHRYQINRFFGVTGDHLNLYNYVMMHDKGHDVAPMDSVLGWRYVSRFRREKDGNLSLITE